MKFLERFKSLKKSDAKKTVGDVSLGAKIFTDWVMKAMIIITDGLVSLRDSLLELRETMADVSSGMQEISEEFNPEPTKKVKKKRSKKKKTDYEDAFILFDGDSRILD